MARKVFLEGGWTQQRLFDIGWSDVSQCQACQLEEGTEKHRLYHCPEWYEVRREIPQVFRTLEQKARTSKEWKWHRGMVTHPLSESQWNRGHFSMERLESEKHKSWCMPAEGFKGQVVTDGFLLGNDGKWGACGWALVQMDYDEEMGPLHGMYGSTEAEFEVQRTVKRAELTAFLCLLKRVIGPIKVDVDNKGIVDGLWRGERERITPKAGDADELHLVVSKGTSVEVEHVKAQRTKKDKEKMPQIERFVTGGNEKVRWQKKEQCWTKDLWQK